MQNNNQHQFLFSNIKIEWMFDLRSTDGKQQNGNATKRHGESAKSERRKYDSQAGGFNGRQ